MSFKTSLLLSLLLLFPTLQFVHAESSEAEQYTQTASQHAEKGEYKDAAKYFKKAHKKDKQSDEYRYQLALAYYHQSKFEYAIEYLQTIIQQPQEK